MKFLFFVVFSSFFTYLNATSLMLGLDIGQFSFEENFDSNYRIGARASFVTDLGFVFDGSVHYLDVVKRTDDVYSFKAVPVLAGLSYNIPFKGIKPYVGVVGGLSIMSSSYDSPLFTYGGKAGFLVDFTKDTSLYMECNQLYIDRDSGVEIEPFQILIGLGVVFGNNGDETLDTVEKSNRQRFKPLRKPRKRKPLPKGPGRY